MAIPEIHLYTPAQANLVIQQGTTKTVPLCRWLPGGTTPYVWQSGDSAKLQIRDRRITQGGIVLAEFATTGTTPDLFFDPSDNFLKWRLRKTVSAAWTWATAYYELDARFANGDELTLMAGQIRLAQQVSD